MIGNIPTDKKGKPILRKGIGVSEYQPSKEIVEVSSLVKKDYLLGYNIQNKPYEEFNNMTFTSRLNKDQRGYNAFSPPESKEPDEAWRWTGVRPVIRQKILGITGHIIARMTKPGVFAQNDTDEEDRQAEKVMRTMMEYNIRNSEYPLSFVFGVLDAMVNPVAYLNLSFDEAYQTIKDEGDEGLERYRVVDNEFSGFQIGVTPADEVLITNANQFYLQKQRAVIRRKFVDYDYLEAKYSNHENFVHVNPGIKTFYDPGGHLFYNEEDDTNLTLGEEVIYYNRREDLQIPFVNGIYMGDEDPADNRMKHRDNRNRPKYPWAKFGYHPISSRFYFYKSLAFELAPDYKLINEMHRLVMDGMFQDLESPMGIMGDAKKVGKSVMMPGAITAFSKDTKIERLFKAGNVAGGFKAIETVENSMKESSQDERRSGVPGIGGRTAYEISKLEENARNYLGLFKKMVGEAVRDAGELMIDIIINHQTIGEVEEVLAGVPRMKFKTFLLSDQVEKGKTVTKKVVFDQGMIGANFTEKQRLKESYKMLKEEGGLKADIRIYRANPYLFSRLKFLTFIAPETDQPVSKAFQKILNLEAYDRMIKNPFVERKAITRDFLVGSFVEKDPDRYMKKEEETEIEKSLTPGGDPSGLLSGLKQSLGQATAQGRY